MAKRGRAVVARKDDHLLRFNVERSLAWLSAFRRLLIRMERLPSRKLPRRDRAHERAVQGVIGSPTWWSTNCS
jgi:hypothetical protein